MDAQTRYCKKCGTPYTLGENFCNKCGERLNTYNETPNTTSDTRTTFPEYENNRSIGTLIFIAIIAIIVIVLIIVALNLNENSGPDYSRQYENTYDHTDTTPPEPEETFETGTVTEDGVYENKFFGIKCVLPDWTYNNEQEIEYTVEAGKSFINDITDSDISEELNSNSQLPVMYATHPDGMTGINVIINKFDNSVIEKMSEKTLIYSFAAEAFDDYEFMGLTGDYEVIEHNINGKTKYVICSRFISEDFSFIFLQFVQLKHNYILVATINAETEEDAFEVCNSIYFE